MSEISPTSIARPRETRVSSRSNNIPCTARMEDGVDVVDGEGGDDVATCPSVASDDYSGMVKPPRMGDGRAANRQKRLMRFVCPPAGDTKLAPKHRPYSSIPRWTPPPIHPPNNPPNLPPTGRRAMSASDLTLVMCSGTGHNNRRENREHTTGERERIDMLAFTASSGSQSIVTILIAVALIIYLLARQFFARPVSQRTLRSEEHTSELQSHSDLVCRLLLDKKKKSKLRLHYKQKKKKII